MSKSFLYVAGFNDGSEYLSKIGITNNPAQRIRDLRSKDHHGLEMCAIYRFKDGYVTYRIEDALAELFSHSVISGKREFFDAPASDIVAHIEVSRMLEHYNHERVL